jgi:hypothetical protein
VAGFIVLFSFVFEFRTFLFCFELIDSALGMGHDEQGYTGSLLMFVLPCFFLLCVVFWFNEIREGKWCSVSS